MPRKPIVLPSAKEYNENRLWAPVSGVEPLGGKKEKGMRRKTSLMTIITALLIVSFAPYTCLAYSGGTGDPNDPYQIANVADFSQLSSTPTHWNKAFILTAGVNLTGLIFTQAPIARATNSSSDGFQGTPFTGVFDGNNHTISNLTITASTKDYIGLFGYVSSVGKLRNLGVENVNITGRASVGGLVGYVEHYKVSPTLTNCYATGSVSGTGNGVGGLVGNNTSGPLTSCYATCSVTGGGYVGGLVGQNYGSLTACYATGSVSGTGNVVGGLAGHNQSTLNSCYATGSVTGGGPVGGLVGLNDGTLTYCFWDMETSGQSGSDGGKGITTSQMKSITTYQNAGWADKGWVINDCLDYPRLSWENTVGVPIPQPQPVPLLGSGSEQDPYRIWTADDFALLSWYVGILDKHIALMTNLDLSGIVLYPIGDLSPFTGVFEGNGNIISNTVINQPGNSRVGLFGYVRTGGQIHNLGVENVNITGGSFAGGLVGYNWGGSLTSCYATGSVTGTGYSRCIGGLVGYNYQGTLTACYATCSVSGYLQVSGLAGYNSGSLTACFWDINTSGTTDGVGNVNPDPNGVAGKTTAEMKTESTFTSAGWDFVWETVNGPNDIWAICEGVSYPKLAWQFIAGDSDNDKDVDFTDFALMGNKWMQADSNLYCGGTDLTGDGWVDLEDFTVFADNWLQSSIVEE